MLALGQESQRVVDESGDVTSYQQRQDEHHDLDEQASEKQRSRDARDGDDQGAQQLEVARQVHARQPNRLAPEPAVDRPREPRDS